MHVQLINKVVYYVLPSTGIKIALTLRTAKILQIHHLRYIFYQIPVFRYHARTICFPRLYGFLKVRQSCYSFYFPRTRVPNDWTNFIAFFSECSVLITQSSVFEPSCAELLFTTKILSETSGVRPCLILNIFISNCCILFLVLRKICLVEKFPRKCPYSH